MRRPFIVTIAGALVSGVILTAIGVHAAPDRQLLVVCSPGSPGTTEEAQPRMDAFASAITARAGAPISAVYEPDAIAGAKRIEGAGAAIVSLPFFLANEKVLGLHARMHVVQKGRPALEHWVLVAQKGRIKKADSLAGFTIMTNTAYAPHFASAAVRDALGALPADVKLVQSTAPLSALRRATNGEPVAVLLDGPSADALASLPFADKLETVARSPAWPAGLVVTVDARMTASAWSALEAALTHLATDRASAGVLDGLQMAGFAPIDDQALTSARNAYAGAR